MLEWLSEPANNWMLVIQTIIICYLIVALGNSVRHNDTMLDTKLDTLGVQIGKTQIIASEALHEVQELEKRIWNSSLRS